MDVLVALWSVKPTSPNFQIFDSQKRVELLKKTLEKTYEVLKGRGIPEGQYLSCIFVAPEYLFAGKQTAPEDPRALGGSEVEAKDFWCQLELDQTLFGIQSIVNALPKSMLLIPGTFYITKAYRRDKQFGKLNLAKRLAEFLGVDHRGNSLYHGNARHIPDFAELLAKFAAPANGLFMQRNRAYVYHEREILFKYNKQTDFHEAVGEDPSKTFFMPGCKEGIFRINRSPPSPPGQLSIGLEICLDHGAKTLKSGRAGSPGHEPDIHIITSDWVRTSDAGAAVAEGGYLIHASSNSAETSVRRREAAGFKWLPPLMTLSLSTSDPGLGQLNFWQIDLP